MLIFYMPPHRDVSEAETEAVCARALQDYIEDLAEFMPEILLAGWREVRRLHKRLGWPLISEIRSACLRHQGMTSRASASQENVLQRMHRNASEIDRLMVTYVTSFMRGDLGQEAKSEGWDRRLKDYVRNEAHLQAQRIVRTGHGSIDVMIPGELIIEWKGER